MLFVLLLSCGCSLQDFFFIFCSVCLTVVWWILSDIVITSLEEEAGCFVFRFDGMYAVCLGLFAFSASFVSSVFNKVRFVYLFLAI